MRPSGDSGGRERSAPRRPAVARGGADPDPGQALVARDHLAACVRRAIDKMTRRQRDLLAVEAEGAAAPDNRVDLLLARRGVVVFRPFATCGQLELVEPEAGDA